MAEMLMIVHSLLLLIAIVAPCPSLSFSDFDQNFVVSWAPWNVKLLNSGDQLQLVLDQTTGSGFGSKEKYLFGNIDMQIKLIPGDSAGTVTAYYLSSETSNHDELDFEFLGNSSGEPYVLQTNVFSNGVGGREQRIFLWFDPTADFHTYSVSWGKQRILFLVDGVPIRAFANNEAVGVPYLSKQPLAVFSSIWNGDSWATQGGAVKINWAHAPFVATYRNFQANACIATNSVESCQLFPSNSHVTADTLDSGKINSLRWVQERYMIYDYCTDQARYSVPPAECNREF